MGTPGHDDSDGLEVLSRQECMRLLGQASLGRVALTVGALPAVFPVHYAVLGDSLVFRSGPGTKLSAAGSGSVVCLEADDVDPEFHTGWSVMVVGRTRLIDDGPELARMQSLPLRPWVGEADAFVEVEASMVSGRRIVAHHVPT